MMIVIELIKSQEFPSYPSHFWSKRLIIDSTHVHSNHPLELNKLVDRYFLQTNIEKIHFIS